MSNSLKLESSYNIVVILLCKVHASRDITVYFHTLVVRSHGTLDHDFLLHLVDQLVFIPLSQLCVSALKMQCIRLIH